MRACVRACVRICTHPCVRGSAKTIVTHKQHRARTSLGKIVILRSCVRSKIVRWSYDRTISHISFICVAVRELMAFDVFCAADVGSERRVYEAGLCRGRRLVTVSRP